MHEVIDTVFMYGPFILALFVFGVYFGLVVFYVKSRQGNDDQISPWWLLVLGPAVLLIQHARKRNLGTLLTKRETWGWIVVAGLMATIIGWKILSKVL